MCIERLNEGRKAACEAVCLANAIHIGTVEEISDLKARKAIEKMEGAGP
jgi:Fe-S-cluster-containing dehydrogenase component